MFAAAVEKKIGLEFDRTEGMVFTGVIKVMDEISLCFKV